MLDADDLPCPACGSLTLEGPYGSYVICGICGWEDDQVQLANPTCGSANSRSLIEAQVSALALYPLDVALANGVRERDARWRPLNDVEKGRAARERDEKYWKNKGIVDTADCYWLNP